MDSVGERIRQLRKAEGISQERLSRRADVSLNVLNRIETGTVTNPHLTTIIAIADALNVSVTDLLEEGRPKAEAPPETPEEAEEQRAKTVEAKPEDLERAARIYEGYTRLWNTELDLLREANVFPWGKSKVVEHYHSYLNSLISELGWMDQAVRIRDEKKRTDPRELSAATRLIDAVKAQDETLRRIQQVENEMKTAAAVGLEEDLRWFEERAEYGRVPS